MDRKHRAEWLKEARWGVFTHFLGAVENTAEEWNRRVNGFDVAGLAAQLAAVGAPYYFITIGQDSGHYCAPNATYDSYVGISPSKCSTRDLVADLYDALHPHGIKLLVYLPGGAPGNDPAAIAALQWQNGPHRNREFQVKRENIMREWSLRWGRKVVGWWFDGCYWPDAMYRFPDPPNFASFAAAARAGNSDSIVAFNPGALKTVISVSEQEDYTAGEINEPCDVECPGRWVDGAQFHVLSFLGPMWCQSPPRFSNEQVIACSRRIVDAGGVITWDVPTHPNGLIPQEFVEQLRAVGQALG